MASGGGKTEKWRARRNQTFKHSLAAASIVEWWMAVGEPDFIFHTVNPPLVGFSPSLACLPSVMNLVRILVTPSSWISNSFRATASVSRCPPLVSCQALLGAWVVFRALTA